MSEKRYPTRMHEVLGVEMGEKFKINTLNGEYVVNPDGELIQIQGELLRQGEVIEAHGFAYRRAINNGIIRKPRLSEEQVRQLKALATLGFRWLIKNNDCSAFAYTYMPEKMDAWWDGANAEVQLFIDMPTGALYNLVSWSDPEPLDIVQTLKDAGVEVE